MRVEDAHVIAYKWHYPAPYGFYNAEADPEDLEELVTPELWPDVFEACLVGDELVGYFSTSVSDGVGSCTPARTNRRPTERSTSSWTWFFPRKTPSSSRPSAPQHGVKACKNISAVST